MHQPYLRRCFDLARLGAGQVSPNPMVGAVLVHGDRIIGEGWHRQYGGPHAEVNAIAAVRPEDRHLLEQATLYCSLEPCSHFGKTPPCVDLILQHRIPHVVVSNTDPNPLVAGRGLQKLRAAGVRVEAGVLQREGEDLNRTFFTWITQNRPFVILKWAQSADGCIGKPGERIPISGPLTQRLVHRWRGESDAILVGTTTALADNPRLDNRFSGGQSPLRIALDFAGKIPADFHLLDDSLPTWILGPERPGHFRQTVFQDILPENWLEALLEQLKDAHRAILLVEGGAAVIRQFLAGGIWDEIRMISAPLYLGTGVRAPELPAGILLREEYPVGRDLVRRFTRHL